MRRFTLLPFILSLTGCRAPTAFEALATFVAGVVWIIFLRICSRPIAEQQEDKRDDDDDQPGSGGIILPT